MPFNAAFTSRNSRFTFVRFAAAIIHPLSYQIDRITSTVSLGSRVERDAPAGYARPLIEPYVQFSRIRLSVWDP